MDPLASINKGNPNKGIVGEFKALFNARETQDIYKPRGRGSHYNNGR